MPATPGPASHPFELLGVDDTGAVEALNALHDVAKRCAGAVMRMPCPFLESACRLRAGSLLQSVLLLPWVN